MVVVAQELRDAHNTGISTKLWSGLNIICFETIESKLYPIILCTLGEAEGAVFVNLPSVVERYKGIPLVKDVYPALETVPLSRIPLATLVPKAIPNKFLLAASGNAALAAVQVPLLDR